MRTIIMFLLAASSASAWSTAQTNWIVDAAGGGHFTDIPAAITAAAPGDRIVVQGSATYSGFLLTKGLDIETASQALTPQIQIVGVPAGQRARVAGFRVPIQGGIQQVSIRSCLGAVALVDVRETGPNFQVTHGKPGLEIVDSARVLVDRGDFVGQPGTSLGGEGMVMDHAQAVFLGTTFRGGVDVSQFPSSGNDGKPGVSLHNGSHAVLCGVGVVGGPASQGNIVGGDGGEGLITDATSAAVVVGASLLQGLPGEWGASFSGSPGEAARGHVRYTLDCTIVGPVAATSIPSRPILNMPTSVMIGASLVVAVQGEPGQWVWLAFDFAHDYVQYPTLDGALVLTSNAILVGGVLLDGLGAGSWGFVVPNAPYAQHLDVIGQGLATVGGSPVLTGVDQTRTR